MPFTRTLLRIASERPTQQAIVTTEESVTYAELLSFAAQIRSAVLRTWIGGGSRERSPRRPLLAVCATSAFRTARLFVALAMHRGVVTVLDPHWPVEQRLQAVVDADLVLTDDPTLRDAVVHRGGTAVLLEELEHDAGDGDPATTPVPLPDPSPFLQLFSSGTTGTPKRFLKTRGQYRANVTVSRSRLGALPGVSTFAPGPLSSSLTLYALVETLATGGTVHLADALDEAWLSDRILSAGITRLVTVPAALHALTAPRGMHRLHGLELVVTGGGPLPEHLRERTAVALPHVRVVNYYGAGELGFIGEARPGAPSTIDLYDGVDAQIRGDDGRPLPPGALGTLWIRSASCSDRYLSSAAAGPLTDTDGWATVHDQARLQDSTLTLAGRAGDVVTTGGHTVSLTDVEHRFAAMPDLGSVCAIALPHPRLGQVVALVVEGEHPEADLLRRWARSHLTPSSRPRRWYRLESLPRTLNGKVRRGRTAALIEDAQGVRL